LIPPATPLFEPTKNIGMTEALVAIGAINNKIKINEDNNSNVKQ
jgi:hypothetical protein